MPWKKTLVVEGLMLESTQLAHVERPLENATSLSISLTI